MITKKELTEVTLSPTKKDYYQIWNELLDLASKISDRWSPTDTNESDPGIVLLKALTAIADKLNYNIDKNTLEAFMPSATQEESMRKLTEMLGYNMKYYRAATCQVSISFKETEEDSLANYSQGIWFPRFLNLTNEDEDINYVTLEAFNISEGQPTQKVTAIEGELVVCESDTDNVVTLKHLDDLNRYILPEIAVAENGLFIYNVSNNQEEELWERVDNLNDKFLGSRIFKFGFDSTQRLPYVQFPEDISQLINSGIKIQYIRTRGADGNISSETLSKFITPAEWTSITPEDEVTDNIKSLTSENFYVKNITSATNGTNPETIDQAYINYKKVVGTFDTLVTCRDYMNKIYQLTDSENNTTPLVSNIIATDIRDDINNAITLCTFNDYGICYENKALSDKTGKALIDHCDLVLYPFKTIYNKKEKRDFINSFKFDTSNTDKIYAELKEIKSLAHNFKVPTDEDIICIKNYLKLKAQIFTKKKVTISEGQEVIQNIKANLYSKFNSRQLDFGEEIPYEHIYEAMLEADSRIKDIILDEPALSTKILAGNNEEYDLVSFGDSDNKDKEFYNKLVLQNVLAGRIAAFSYQTDMLTDYRDMPYKGNLVGAAAGETTEYEVASCYSDDDKYIHKLVAKYEPSTETTKPIVLKDNQVIQFRMPNLKTTVTYPAYVNYYFIKGDAANNFDSYYPATLQPIYDYVRANATNSIFTNWLNSTSLVDRTSISIEKNSLGSRTYEAWIAEQKNKYGTTISETYFDESNNIITVDTEKAAAASCKIEVLDFTSNTLTLWYTYFKNTIDTEDNKNNGITFGGIFKNNGVDLKKTPGYLIDSSKISYSEITTVNTNYADGNLKHFYIQVIHPEGDLENNHTKNGLGKDGGSPGVSTKTTYQLQEGDFLFINYSDSSDSESDAKAVINKIYTAGDIIKPNFELVDSSVYHNSHSYTKKDNFNFDGYNSSVPGMFTLGTNEQIDIQEIEKVEIDGTANLYWTLNSDQENETLSTFYFKETYYDNKILQNDYGVDVKNAYTLKEGEYLYYTNSKKTDLAYYGAGTIIVKGPGWGSDNFIRDNNNNITIEEVEENGLSASIPWTTFYFEKGSNNSNKAIYIIGTQSITLTSGDTLEFASIDENITSKEASNSTISLARALTEEWQEVKSAKYKFAEKEASEFLPKINIKLDSSGEIKHNVCWQIRSRLDLSMNEGFPQTLHQGDSVTVHYRNTTDDHDITETTIIAPLYVKAQTPSQTEDFVGEPLVLQPNKLVQSAVGEAIVSYGVEIDSSGFADSLVTDFNLRVTKRKDIITKTQNVLQLNNYVNNNNYFTKYTFSGEPTLGGKIYQTKSSAGDHKYKFKILSVESGCDYYLVGKFTNWQTIEKYKLETSEEPEIEYLISANTKFSVVKKSATNYSTIELNTDFEMEEVNNAELNNLIEENKSRIEDFTLRTDIPKNYGLIMMYWIYDDSLYNSTGKNKKIKAEAKIETYSLNNNEYVACEGIKRFNGNELYSSITLNRGFNMIHVDKDVKLLKVFGTCGNLIFDNLKLIDEINPALKYQKISADSPLEQLLFDISTMPEASNFYCTAPILSETAIDINSAIDSDNFLDNALCWYDANNIANKFVISEIDADFLTNGLFIAKTSRV